MYYKVKLAAIALGASTVIVPPTLYKASETYIALHHRSSAYLSDIKKEALRAIGLVAVAPETNLDTLIKDAATEYKLNPKLLAALVLRESGRNSDAYSPKSAIGLAQIMPFNAKRCGLNKISKLWDERTNIRCGAQILSEELATAKGKLNPALQTYNGGPKCINKCQESINYARIITATFAEMSLKD